MDKLTDKQRDACKYSLTVEPRAFASYFARLALIVKNKPAPFTAELLTLLTVEEFAEILKSDIWHADMINVFVQQREGDAKFMASMKAIKNKKLKHLKGIDLTSEEIELRNMSDVDRNADLMRLTISQLNPICALYGVIKGKNKQETVDRIVQHELKRGIINYPIKPDATLDDIP